MTSRVRQVRTAPVGNPLRRLMERDLRMAGLQNWMREGGIAAATAYRYFGLSVEPDVTREEFLDRFPVDEEADEPAAPVAVSTYNRQRRYPLEQFASAWRIPTEITGQHWVARIGGCVYGRYPGIFVYMVAGEMNAFGLQHDGTWNKYGEPFETPEAAYEALLGAEIRWHDPEKQ